jgi:hypothetical protein
MSRYIEHEITTAAALSPPPELYPRGIYFVVRMERSKGLRLGPVLNEALRCLRHASARPKGFDIRSSQAGVVFLEWLFISEDEARIFADAMSPPRFKPAPRPTQDHHLAERPS